MQKWGERQEIWHKGVKFERLGISGAKGNKFGIRGGNWREVWEKWINGQNEREGDKRGKMG